MPLFGIRLGSWGGGSRSLLFVLLFEFKVLCDDPCAGLTAHSQPTGSRRRHAQQISNEPLNCNHLSTDERTQEERDMQRGTFSLARFFFFFKEHNININIKSSKLETHFAHFFFSRLECSVCAHSCADDATTVLNAKRT